MDLIDRQATLDAVDNIHQEHLYKQIGDRDTYTPYNEGWADACDRIDSVLRGLPSAQRWIPCSERLPQNERKTYWVCTEIGSQHECRWTNNRYGLSESDRWGWSVFDVPRCTEVVAWMPLPDPYKGSEKNE